MRGRAAHIEIVDGSAVVGPAGNGAEEEELFERKFTLENVALRETEFALEIERGEDLLSMMMSLMLGACSAMVLMTLSPKVLR